MLRAYRFHSSIAAIAVLLAVSLASSSPASEEAESVKELSQQWIQLQRRELEIRKQWAADREVLNQNLIVLKKSLQDLRSDFDQRQASEAHLLKRLNETEEALERQRRGNERLSERMAELEQRVIRLSRFCPPPLMEKIAPAVRNLDAGGNPNPSARIQSMLTVVTFMNEFNNSITEGNAERTIENGDLLTVRVLYWGLAQAYAVNADGSRAWTITPAIDSWKWEPSDSLGPQVRRLFDVYDGKLPPEFVALPARLSIEREEAK